MSNSVLETIHLEDDSEAENEGPGMSNSQPIVISSLSQASASTLPSLSQELGRAPLATDIANMKTTRQVKIEDAEMTMEDKDEQGQGPSAPIEPEEASFDIEVIFSITSLVAVRTAQKLGKRRKPEVKSATFTVPSTMVFDTFKAQLVARFSSATTIQNHSFDAFEIKWSIPRTRPTETAFATSKDWKDAVSLLRAKKEGQRTVKLLVMEQAVAPTQPVASSSKKVPASSGSSKNAKRERAADDKENPEDAKPAKKPKTKIPKEAGLTDFEINEAEIKLQLDEKWACSTKECASRFCYVSASHGNIHIALSAQHYHIWTQGIIKGPETATIESPPNHHLFDLDSANRSPLVQRRQANPKSSEVSAPPAFHLHVPTEAFAMFQNLQANPSTPSVSTSIPSSSGSSKSAAGPNISPASHMTLSEFTRKFDIPASLQEKLRLIDIRGTHAFSYISDADLRTEGKLTIGELADFKYAKAEWERQAQA